MKSRSCSDPVPPTPPAFNSNPTDITNYFLSLPYPCISASLFGGSEVGGGTHNHSGGVEAILFDVNSKEAFNYCKANTKLTPYGNTFIVTSNFMNWGYSDGSRYGHRWSDNEILDFLNKYNALHGTNYTRVTNYTGLGQSYSPFVNWEWDTYIDKSTGVYLPTP